MRKVPKTMAWVTIQMMNDHPYEMIMATKAGGHTSFPPSVSGKIRSRDEHGSKEEDHRDL